MRLHISSEEARRFLALYHFRPTDLVFQARVPGYQVDDWQKAAYTDRLIYDAWDKRSSPPKYRSTRAAISSTVSESIQSA
jgi:hypothetical protein